MRCNDGSVIDTDYLKVSLSVMLSVLQKPKPTGCEDYEHYRILLSALRGLQNVLAASKEVHHDQLGALLAAMKGYMLYGLPGIGTAIHVPSTLYPSSFFQYDIGASPPAKSTAAAMDQGVSLRPGGGGSKPGSTPKASSKKSKKKKSKSRQGDREEQGAAQDGDSYGGDKTAGTPSTTTPSATGAQEGEHSASLEVPSLWPAWGRVSSSESEYSDTEGGQAAKMRSATSKIRQAALACLHATVKNTEKRVVFGYWSAFIPDAPPGKGHPHAQTLFTSMLKDPAPKVRVGSVVVLGSFLDGSKQFLAAADDRIQNRPAFTPFSSILASTIKEIHRCLLLALVAETFSTTITQLIKCLSILVQNVPYHKLSEGLLTRIIKAIKPFFTHKDNNVRTACLTCMGAILANNPPLPEITSILQTADLPMTSASQQGGGSSWRPRSEADQVLDWRKGTRSEADDVKNQVKDEGTDRNVEPSLNALNIQDSSPRQGTSADVSGGLGAGKVHDSGAEMDVEEKAAGGADDGVIPWVVKWCGNVVLDDEEAATDGSHTDRSQSSSSHEALPVKLEALQVLTQLVKGYFPTIRHILNHLCGIIISCLQDKDGSIKLHGLKVLEEFGKGMLHYGKSDQPSPDAPPDVLLESEEVVAIWTKLLSGPLPGILQQQENSLLQASGCDCISTIGPQALQLLKNDKQILCITLLLGLSNDEDYRVKASAVRALGVYVLYPCLREDVMFVADSANAILDSLKDNSVNVRMRAAWSLGNLSDALIANKEAGDTAFMDEFADMLLHKLLEAATKGAGDHDKVKSNAVRAVGMLIEYAGPQALAKPGFQTLLENAIQALVKNITTGAVKVRWNACYAIGNVYRNTHLDLGGAPWSAEVYRALTGVIRDCKNFKVRINGALALSIPDRRCCYGDTEQFCMIWGSLTHALEVIDQIADVSELKYRDTLRDQICMTMIHLCTMIASEDLLSLQKIIRNKEEMLTKNIVRYREAKLRQLGTDSVLDLDSASSHLKELHTSMDTAHTDSISVMVCLQEIFKTADSDRSC
ncbi:HEAT repeat-containing protein 6-like isoform X2 [Amphiura filiformis]|uniref:HEAT repeat-containing protein 6-like isoform X2 n=1 Tax=Amphiura filiformis TaxID=82378 RepID=UPI003B2231E9